MCVCVCLESMCWGCMYFGWWLTEPPLSFWGRGLCPLLIKKRFPVGLRLGLFASSYSSLFSLGVSPIEEATGNGSVCHHGDAW